MQPAPRLQTPRRITTLSKLFGALDPYRWLIGAGLVLAAFAAIWGYGLVQYNKGHAKALAAATEQVAKERAAELGRQANANQAAQEAAQQSITQLLAERDNLEAMLKENAVAASRDAGARSCGVGRDSVRRLNQVR